LYIANQGNEFFLEKVTFLVNFYGNFQVKPDFVRGKTWQLKLENNFFLKFKKKKNCKFFFIFIFLKKGREF